MKYRILAIIVGFLADSILRAAGKNSHAAVAAIVNQAATTEPGSCDD